MNGWTVFQDQDGLYGVSQDAVAPRAHEVRIIQSGLDFEHACDVADRMNADDLAGAEYPHA